MEGGTKKLQADIPYDLHVNIKATAALKGITLSEYVTKLLSRALTQDGDVRNGVD